ncbi:hypothetical protein Tco_0809425 [Tanacetum coccineum]
MLLDSILHGPFQHKVVAFPANEAMGVAAVTRMQTFTNLTHGERVNGRHRANQARKKSKLAYAFDILASEKGETIHSYYIRFSKLMNDINIIGLDMTSDEVFLAREWHLEEIHVTWAHLEKKHIDLNQGSPRIVFSERGDGVPSTKRRRRDLFESWIRRIQWKWICRIELSTRTGLEVGSIRRINGLDYGAIESSGVRTTFDIFQSIHILYLQYGVLVFSGYVRIELVSFVVFGECRHGYVVSSLMDTAYW